MALRFIGIDPNTGQGESPTVWVDETRGELVIQGWKPDAATEAECAAISEDEAAARLCAAAFEAVWARAIPHDDYKIH